MASRYDYPDPGQDPEYCNGLAPEPEEWYGEVCEWCSEPLPHVRDVVVIDEYWPYCSSLCATQAAADSEGSEV